MTERNEDQSKLQAAFARWPRLLQELTAGEGLVAIAKLKLSGIEVNESTLQLAAAEIRKQRTEPTGSAYEARMARNNGVEYRGGPVCWDPEVLCEGVCLDCPKESA